MCTYISQTKKRICRGAIAQLNGTNKNTFPNN